MMIKITPVEHNGKGICNPPGKLADVELVFLSGPLAGLRLIGFGIWERTATRVPADRGTSNARNVTFPARSYSVNGERRNFALLRPSDGDTTAQTRIRDLILDAYAEYEAQADAEAHADFGPRRLDGGPSRPDCHD